MDVVAMYSSEPASVAVEYIATTEADKEMLWLKHFLTELGIKQEDYKIYCDNQSVIDLNKSSMYYSRTKHINIYYHWICEVIDQQLLKLMNIHTKENPVDMLKSRCTREAKLCRDIAGIDGKWPSV